MIKTSVVFACALTALAQDGVPMQFHFPAPVAQQNAGKGMPPFGAPGPLGKQPGFFRIDRIDSLMLYFNAVAEPPLDNSENLQLAWVVNKTQNVRHRFVIDKVHYQYFGHDVSVQPPASAQHPITRAPPSTVLDAPACLGGTPSLAPLAVP